MQQGPLNNGDARVSFAEVSVRTEGLTRAPTRYSKSSDFKTQKVYLTSLYICQNVRAKMSHTALYQFYEDAKSAENKNIIRYLLQHATNDKSKKQTHHNITN